MPTKQPHSPRGSCTTTGLPWLAAAVLLLAFGAAAEPVTVASVASPGKVLRVSVQLDGGTPSYQVERFGDTVVAPSRLGFQLRDGRLDRDLEVLGQHTRAFDETWEQPWGERRRVRNHYNEVVVQLGERSGAKRRFEVVFRAFDDGVGFRYRFPSSRACARRSSTTN